MVLGFFSWLFGGCGKTQEPTGREALATLEPLEITSESEEGFHDLVFRISSQESNPDRTQKVHVSGVHKGTPVGFDVLLGAEWKKGSLGEGITTYQGIVICRSTGNTSDAFIRIIDILYGSNLNPTSMGKETHFTGISLEGNPAALFQGPAKIKLFFEPEDENDYEERYAELFMNFNLKERKMWLSEKDEEYRPAIIRAFQSDR